MPTEVGPTDELSLRASVATLSRVQFSHPETGATTLALEHKATVHVRDGEPDAHLVAQPFGGAVQIPSPAALQEQLGPFHFDSPRSRLEQDFRIFIKPSQWPTLKMLVRRELEQETSPLIDPDPGRELEEEFQDTLNYSLSPDQYSSKRLRVVVEDEPVPTRSWRAPGRMTARIYCIHEVRIEDDDLCRLIVGTSQIQTPPFLLKRATERAEAGGQFGRANGIFLAPLSEIQRSLQELDAGAHGGTVPFKGTSLSPSVAAIVDEISSPRYRLLSP